MLKKQSSSKRKKVSVELILYNDLVINKEGCSIAEEVGINKDDKVYREAPNECSDCRCKNVISLQVLGATNKGLLWVCDLCEKVFLKYTYRYTVMKLKTSKEYWTVPSAWEPPETKEGLN